MCLVRVLIEDGPTRRKFNKLLRRNGKMYFKAEGKFYPHRVSDFISLNDGGIRFWGYTLTGLFVAEYDFKKRRGSLLTKYGRVVDDV